MNKNTGKITIKNDKGVELECDVLFTFDDEETKKSYIIFTDNTVDEKGNIKVYANSFDPDNENSDLGEITTEKEWQIIENLLASLQEKLKKLMVRNQMEKKQFNIDAIISKIILILTITGAAALIIFFCVSLYFLSPVNHNNEAMIEFEVKEGSSKIGIAQDLDKAGLIKSAFFFKIYMKVNEQELYAGTYNLSKSMSVDDIIKILNTGMSLENETITVTFIEGKKLNYYINQISKTFDLNEEECFSKLEDEIYLNNLITKYWFLTKEILNPEIIHPLEGYLFPDTYIIRKNTGFEEVIDKMLSTMDNKLNIYKDEILISNYNIHELLTLASIVELEGANSDDRAGVAGVFYNRLKAGWTLGSDVTTYYLAGKNFNVDLTKTELNACNPYNTRGECVPALPVGPIASPSLASISATIEPAEHEYFYFVADISKKTHYSKTQGEHDDIIAKLKREGNWFNY